MESNSDVTPALPSPTRASDWTCGEDDVDMSAAYELPSPSTDSIAIRSRSMTISAGVARSGRAHSTASTVHRSADPAVLRQAPSVTTGPDDPQPRDIALEQETSELEAALEAQSEPESGSDES